MALRDEIAKWRDADGLVSPTVTTWGQRSASGNGLLYTALYFILLARRGEWQPVDAMDLDRVLRSCQLAPGLYRRGPVHPDQEGVDDYVGLGAPAYVAGLPHIAVEILRHGRERPFRLGPVTLRYNYCNITTENVLHRSSWMGRQPQWVAHLMWAAGERPGFFRRLWWVVTIATSGGENPPEGQDAYLLSWLLIQTMGNRCLMGRIAAWFWRRRLRRKWGTMREVVARVLKPEHPVAVYWV